jgi:hypothetical protein
VPLISSQQDLNDLDLVLNVLARDFFHRRVRCELLVIIGGTQPSQDDLPFLDIHSQPANHATGSLLNQTSHTIHKLFIVDHDYGHVAISSLTGRLQFNDIQTLRSTLNCDADESPEIGNQPRIFHGKKTAEREGVDANGSFPTVWASPVAGYLQTRILKVPLFTNHDSNPTDQT